MAASIKAPSMFVTLGIDRSGSMMSFGDSVNTGLRTYINNLPQDATLRIYTFDTEKEVPLKNKRVGDINDEDLKRIDGAIKPRGSTTIFDFAVEEMKKQSTMDGSTQFALFTDGQDNASSITAQMFCEKVKAHQKKGVECVFLAANQDAMMQGSIYGFSKEKSLTVDCTNAQAALLVLAKTTSAACGTRGHPPISFSKLDRVHSAPAHHHTAAFPAPKPTPTHAMIPPPPPPPVASLALHR